MPRSALNYRCSSCGALHPKWAGRCEDCGAWNTLVEEVSSERKGRSRRADPSRLPRPVRLAEIDEREWDRYPTGSREFDRVLGGGLVPGSIVLLGGDPGIGKSTLLLQVGAYLARTVPTLYVSGEESLAQIALRARRLQTSPPEGFGLLAETSLETVLAVLESERPRVVVIDSIQTVSSEAVESAPGSVSQLRECTAALVRWGKKSGSTVLVVGHVTKEGTIAGPRVLEHLVDAVLYFESETSSRYRMVRAVKNRFGAVHEVGLFAMVEGGLREVANPSALFLSRHGEPVPGSAVGIVHEGTRPLLAEVQALVDQDERPVPPRRVALGIDGARLVMLLAVAPRRLGLALSGRDVFVNLVGGLRSEETALDLPVLLAVLSSLADRPLPQGLAAFGEVGLAGEIRPVPYGLERAAEATKQGYAQVLLPRDNLPRKAQGAPPGLTAVGDLLGVLEALRARGWDGASPPGRTRGGPATD
ncbi:MAG: DNA repair protein RadA [Gammaproteobacteria bacterium]|nr:DNA repair protein RadA [Gammaproteobacteria bacterium]